MSIQLQAQFSKKLPIPGADFSSQQASITITAEVADLNQVVAEAQRLYALCEQAVDRQLSGQASVPHPSTVTASGPNAPTRPAARPFPGSRRGPAPVTDSQLRFLNRLIRNTGTDLNAVLHHHQVGDLRDLSCKAAAGLIDELKGREVRA